jgi:RNA polymerase sigma-70 factor (ECF subfamily)
MSWITTTRFPALSASRNGLGAKVSVSANEREINDASDELLLSRCRDGDSEAFSILFRRYYGLLRVVSVRILQDEAEAEDLVQDVFLFIHNQAGIFDSSRSTGRSWIVQMTYRRAISRRRYLSARGHYRSVDSSGLSDAACFDCVRYDSSIEALFGRERIKSIMAALTAEQYETLHLHFYEGYTLLEISQKLGQSLGNIRHHYYRGLEKFRREIIQSKLMKP